MAFSAVFVSREKSRPLCRHSNTLKGGKLARSSSSPARNFAICARVGFRKFSRASLLFFFFLQLQLANEYKVAVPPSGTFWNCQVAAYYRLAFSAEENVRTGRCALFYCFPSHCAKTVRRSTKPFIPVNAFLDRSLILQVSLLTKDWKFTNSENTEILTSLSCRTLNYDNRDLYSALMLSFK